MSSDTQNELVAAYGTRANIWVTMPENNIYTFTKLSLIYMHIALRHFKLQQQTFQQKLQIKYFINIF
jgi:hypothetical protein